jgi:LPXTG-motif cell wall-anchored protein
VVTVRAAVAASAPKAGTSLFSGTSLFILLGAGAAVLALGGWILARRRQPARSGAHAPSSTA